MENDFHAFEYVQVAVVKFSSASREGAHLVFDTPVFFARKVYDNDWDSNPKPSKWDHVGNEMEWGVVFIDHRPGERRKVDIERFRDKAEIIVVHDTDEESYMVNSVLNTFNFRHDYKVYRTHTTLVSNKVDVSKLF
jgi:hypothetical protein